MTTRFAPFAFILFFACAPPARTPGPPSSSDALASVAFIHGGAGPWAVAGYRMGEAAMRKLGLERQSFDLLVVHHTPEEVQFSCIADGASAATGASAGKLNLKLVPTDEAHVVTVYENRATRQTVTLRPTAAFAARFKDVPRDKLAEAGREVMALPDDEVFEEVTGGGAP
jgi:formylmethanofuran dehydrogenase subunit E